MTFKKSALTLVNTQCGTYQKTQLMLTKIRGKLGAYPPT
ncbi:hypothetical protein PESP_a1932 [Pseudoalteromonas espejiana DSM 9414]|nr:hypothetical protein PESP_a1932 [Pseudoalteromonas espejiana DSM 9414]